MSTSAKGRAGSGFGSRPWCYTRIFLVNWAHAGTGKRTAVEPGSTSSNLHEERSRSPKIREDKPIATAWMV